MIDNIDFLPQFSGSYALFLCLSGENTISVGRLGTFLFPAGGYIYLGSAHGPGGLRSRLGRHLRQANRLHWHIDYLRQHATVVGCAYVTHQENGLLMDNLILECLWSQALYRLPDMEVPVPGFGASDCRHGCPSHLLFSQSLKANLEVILETLSARAGRDVKWLLF